MRIVHVQDYFHPEIGYQENFIAKVQVAKGHEVHFITSDRHVYSPHYDEIFKGILGPRIIGKGTQLVNGIKVHRLPVKYALLDRLYRPWLIGLEREIVDISPDLIIVHGMQSLTSFRLARWVASIKPNFKVIFDSHAAKFNSQRVMRSFFYLFFRMFMKNFYLKCADAIVTIDNWGKEFLIKECGIEAEKITIIPLGADHKLFIRNERSRSEIRDEWGVFGNEAVFIYVGKVIPPKQVHLLIDAGGILHRKGYDFTIVVVGGGPSSYLQYLHQRAAANTGLKIFFYSHMPNDQLPKFYSGADISVWPASISIGIYEAMSCSLPLIVADEPWLIEYISTGNGLSYSQGSVEDLAEKMKWMIEHPKERMVMGEYSRKRIVDELNWETLTKRMMDSVGLSL